MIKRQCNRCVREIEKQIDSECTIRICNHFSSWTESPAEISIRNIRSNCERAISVQIQKNKRRIEWKEKKNAKKIVYRFNRSLSILKRLRAYTAINFMIMGFNGSAIISLFINRENIQLYILSNFQREKNRNQNNSHSFSSWMCFFFSTFWLDFHHSLISWSVPAVCLCWN